MLLEQPSVVAPPRAAASDARVSIVIPALNEAGTIAGTLEAIERALGPSISYETIVVDNASVDGTAEIARAGGATVLTCRDRTIAGLRNHGFSSSSGETIVFLDADVLVTPQWAARLPEVLKLLGTSPRLVTGATCDIPPRATWLERWWFGPRVGRSQRYINSGHMIVSRSFFQELGGFDEACQTGEDHELCMRAWAAGGRVLEDPALRVVHDGYPRTLRAFVRRERWHGRGDFATLRTALRSRMALATMLFLALHVGALAAALAASPGWVAALLAGIALLCLATSAWKYRGAGAAVVGVNALIFYVYFVGRALALLGRASADAGFRRRDRR